MCQWSSFGDSLTLDRLGVNHFSFASLTLLGDFLQRLGGSACASLTSISVPLWRQGNLLKDNVQVVVELLKHCTNLRRVEIQMYCSRVGCPAVHEAGAEEYVGDVLLYDLSVAHAIRELPNLEQAFVAIDGCLFFTHGSAGMSLPLYGSSSWIGL